MAFTDRVQFCLTFVLLTWHDVLGITDGPAEFPSPSQTSPSNNKLKTRFIVHLQEEVMNDIDGLWNIVRNEREKLELQPVKHEEEYFLNYQRSILKPKLEKMEKLFNIYLVGANVFRLRTMDLKVLPSAPEWASIAKEIWTAYQNFTNKFVNDLDTHCKAKYEFLALNTLGRMNGAIKRLNSYKEQKLYNEIRGAARGHQYICSMEQSPHQLIYNLYNVIALAEIKGYAMIQLSYMILTINKDYNFTIESERQKTAFENQAQEKLLVANRVLENMSTKYWKCDPLQHEESRTFIRMTQLLQGIIENEADIHPGGSCKDECSDFITGHKIRRCTRDRICSHQNRCEGGRVYDCQFFDRDADVCFSADQYRRYDYVKYEDGTLLGKYDRCHNGQEHKVDSWWRFPYHCSMCVCKCDAEGPTSDRYWSLKTLTADLNQGMVVTGVRFVKRNRVIQMDIEQAQALPEGAVNETTKGWKLAPSLDISKATPEEMFTMSYKSRDIDLDLLEVPKHSMVTGIRFRDLGGHINMEIQATPIEFLTGNLKEEQSVWIGNDNTRASSNPRKCQHIIQPDVPTRNRISRIMADNNQFVRFDTSDVQKDAMQMTIPYIDAQPVTTNPGSWLSGLGLYYKGRNGYGGFVGPMIQTFDFSGHLLPKESKTTGFDMQPMKSWRYVRVLSRQRRKA
ncbi:hypothetical protein TCAL_08833 [Tigriopus californicus]|uniref:Uncharacterized protein n=1 Tax=Tigriopus californicus TaxID=6832 RepID=A0A553PQ87_TIGCA|nr:uncharacterized protein LOC131882584 [Tigriopus californicus]TRY79845.1 hypothetical protein TCAL_08833 [Tigriopus californicus]|eukprot:TCALIF_08833-PA protein Name:"Protein of unknown function" AED:0.07 eAED:0.07 QI:0/0.4/0.16/1/1/1/6/151/679